MPDIYATYASGSGPATQVEPTEQRSSRAVHWELVRTAKYSHYGVPRAIPPEETVRRVLPLLSAAGITRVAEVTHLDRLGIPNFIAVRPRDRGSEISYYNGKGCTVAQARASAIMEAFERYSGEHCVEPVVCATYNGILRSSRAVDPREIVIPALQPYDDDLVLEWVCGYDLIQQEATFVPLNSVVCPYIPRGGEALYFSSTNGLAAGNTLVEALCQALCEVLERDAESMTLAAVSLRASVDAVIRTLGAQLPVPSRATRHRLLSPEGMPRPACCLLERIRRSGLRAYVRDLTCTTGIPTIDCAISERLPDGRQRAHGGFGTHPDSRVALIRALTEAAQSRVACIQGGREDLPEITAHMRPPNPEETYRDSEVVPFSSLPSFEHHYIDDDVREILHAMRQDGLEQAIAFDMTQPELGIPVVRVVVPKAETWATFHMHTGRGKFGPRVARQLLQGDNQWTR